MMYQRQTREFGGEGGNAGGFSWLKFGTRRRACIRDRRWRKRDCVHARMRIVFSAIEGPRRAPKPEIMAVTREIGSSIFGDGNPDVIRRR
jgi:hypothetical protein